MEYLPNNNIFDNLCKGVYFNFEEKCEIIYRICEGINYLHERKIAHRDIKPENILFDAKFQPKLIDFGLANEYCEKCKTFCGTIQYMAPEMVRNCNYNGIKSDIWSFGVTAHLIICGDFPWSYQCESKYLHDAKSGHVQINIQCRGPMAKIIEKCLEMDPEKRPSAQKILDMISQIDLMKSKTRTILSEKIVIPKVTPRDLRIKLSTPLFDQQRFTSNSNPQLRIRKNFSF